MHHEVRYCLTFRTSDPHPTSPLHWIYCRLLTINLVNRVPLNCSVIRTNGEEIKSPMITK